MHCAETAGGLSEHRPSAFSGDRSIRRVYVLHHVPNDVGRVVAVVNGIDVLRAAQTRESVHDDQNGGRHALLTDERVDPLNDVALPRTGCHERGGVAGISMQHIQHGIAPRTGRIVARGKIHDYGAFRRIAQRIVRSASLVTKSTCTSPS